MTDDLDSLFDVLYLGPLHLKLKEPVTLGVGVALDRNLPYWGEDRPLFFWMEPSELAVCEVRKTYRLRHDPAPVALHLPDGTELDALPRLTAPEPAPPHKTCPPLALFQALRQVKEILEQTRAEGLAARPYFDTGFMDKILNAQMVIGDVADPPAFRPAFDQRPQPRHEGPRTRRPLPPKKIGTPRRAPR